MPRIRNLLTASGLGLLAYSWAAAHEPGAHVHGVGELRVVVDGSTLDISLESPLDNVLGFEHAPRTERERAVVRAMAGKLRQAQNLFSPTPEARCTLQSVQLASAALPPALLGGGSPDTGADSRDEDGHADLDANFQFRCASPAQLSGMEIALAEVFPGFRRINVQVAAVRGQSAAVLLAGQRHVGW